MVDPVENVIRKALLDADVEFVEENDPRALGLDFFLVEDRIHIEVKQFHSERISEQMSRAVNVIAIQGLAAAEMFAEMIRNEAAYHAACSAAEDRRFD